MDGPPTDDRDLTADLRRLGAGWETSRLQAKFDRLLAADAGRAAILTAVEEAMASPEDPLATIDLLRGLRELCHWSLPEPQQAFHEQLTASPAFTAILALPGAPNLRLRGAAVHLLGQFGGPAALPALEESFNRAIDADPVLIPTLLTAIAWLRGQAAIHTHYDRVLAARRDLCRWSLLESSVWPHLSPEQQLPLSHDRSPYIAAEAAFLLADRALCEAVSSLPPSERRRRLQSHRATAPTLTFAAAEQHLYRHLRDTAQDDYTIPTWERLLAAPISSTDPGTLW